MSGVLLPWLVDGLVILGLVVITAAVYGLLWLPDAYMAIHAASKVTVLGLCPILLAAMLAGSPAGIPRLLLVTALLLLTVPITSHVLALAAYQRKEPMRSPDAVDESGRLS